jgi:hypothetical protein
LELLNARTDIWKNKRTNNFIDGFGGKRRKGNCRKNGKHEFRRTDFGSRLLAAEGEGGGAVRVRSVSEVKQYPSGSDQKSTAKVITAKFLLSEKNRKIEKVKTPNRKKKGLPVLIFLGFFYSLRIY